MRSRRTEHIPDRSLDAEFAFPGSSGLPSSLLGVPLLREDRVEGVFTLTRNQVAPFTARQIQLVESFADQSMIAIENTRLFTESKEALERQTATAEVLQVISNSISDATPVFERILESTERLITFENAAIFLAMPDEQLHLAAARGPHVAAIKGVYPRPMAQSTAPIVMEARRQVCYEDVVDTPDVPAILRQIARGTAEGNFSIAMTPLMWEGNAIGMLNVARGPGVKFNEKELSLLRTFADQAVIAIQNARLFNETQQALARQTATRKS